MASHNNDLWFILAAITAISVGSAVMARAEDGTSTNSKEQNEKNVENHLRNTGWLTSDYSR